MRKVSLSILILAALMMAAVFAVAQEAAKAPAKAAYVGADKCKMCHKDIYAAWEKTGHAKAFTVLAAEEQKKAECVTCHVTGAMADGKMIEGVTCEACHGAGSDYKSPKIMSKKWKEDPSLKKAALEAGLVYPTAENCVKCHTKEGNPNFKPFDFEKAKGLVHPVAAAETTGK